MNDSVSGLVIVPDMPAMLEREQQSTETTQTSSPLVLPAKLHAQTQYPNMVERNHKGCSSSRCRYVSIQEQTLNVISIKLIFVCIGECPRSVAPRKTPLKAAQSASPC